jgi:primosomal protein N' (replication factor Y) (superfamily II helicase)
MVAQDKKAFADVAVPALRLDPLTYSVPQRFIEDIDAGCRVLVPLGRRRAAGIVVGFPEKPRIGDCRPIEDMLDPYPLLPADLLRLTRWVADYYLSSWAEAIRAALPPGLSGVSQRSVRRTGVPVPEDQALSATELGILEALPAGRSMTVRGLERRMEKSGLQHALGRLERRGLLTLEQELDAAPASVRMEKWITVKTPVPAEALAKMRKRAPKQARVLESLAAAGGEMKRTDVDADSQVLKRLASAGWIEVWEEARAGETMEGPEPEAPDVVVLNSRQMEAVARIREGLESGLFSPILLHGVTGSGKTRVYLEAVGRCLELGRAALVLIPEISLTPQAVQRYRGAFGGRVAVLHSGLSRGERFDAWRRIREGEATIALGPRSTVFAPLKRLGLIVVDEEHDSSYKQDDPAPRYHARDTALVRGRMTGCTVILGSATPSLESYANAQLGRYALCELPERARAVPMPSVEVVDMTETIRAGTGPVFSPVLLQKIRTRLQSDEQVILLQNRRGYAPTLRCGSCGHVDKCPHCEISLSFHRGERRMRCHYCGYQRPPLVKCPSCGGATLQYRGAGTEKIEEELGALFPGALLIRMDSDALRRKGAHARALSLFGSRKSSILLGTQMVAKGHDFPGVTLVGVVSADTGLHFPDFRSAERTFQLLTQAAGRAGRQGRRGEVVIQTLSPGHPVLEFAQRHAFREFYDWEMKQREELHYPPYGRIVLVGFRGPNEKQVMEAAVSFTGRAGRPAAVQILGPAPAPIPRLKNEYRVQVIFRIEKVFDPDGAIIRHLVRKMLAAHRAANPAKQVRLSVDVDPSDMM